MTDLCLENADLALTVTTRGGSIWRFAAKTPQGPLAILREPPTGADRAATAAACFPLVPCGNRISGNRFIAGGVEHRLNPNTAGDRHYLHGDGWLADWSIRQRAPGRATLQFSFDGQGSPYVYEATQSFALSERRLILTLSVTNRGAFALPFGLGWHPYFPLTPETTVLAPARSYWLEGQEWLPTVEAPLTPDLDFAEPKRVPRRWLNNGFEGWDGFARIAWPDRRASLAVAADALFRRYFLYVPDKTYDPDYANDYFCFEPMSHSADAHNGRGGGLVHLAPGESLTGEIRLIFEPQGQRAFL
jgi:aldose 1-epimerase